MYHALYRKYRPFNFEDVVGQDIIKKTLMNSIKNGSINHAYMFFGPRGVGKTTISKIFARAVNCLDPVNGNACGKCKNCLYSAEKECVDIIEIDAASNNGVDEIRELKNKVSLVPAELKYKVYIIDEVHMLSIGAFNAFLKTLEEPPQHVIFILATTDPQKVPDTIISRCQCFSFNRISEEIIVERLKYVCSKEKIDIDEEVLHQIALISDGGLRDSLGMLDKLRSYSEEKITMQDFADLNGMVTKNELNSLISSIFSGNIAEIFNIIADFSKNGKNLIQIMLQLMNFSRNLLVDYYIDNKKLDFDVNFVHELTNLINERMFDIKKSSNPRIFIEMLLIKFTNDEILHKNISQEIILNKMVDNQMNLSSKINQKCNKTENISIFSSNEKEEDINKNNSFENDINLEKNNDCKNENIKYSISNNDAEKEKIDNIISKKDNCYDSNFVSNNYDNILNIDEIMNIRLNNTFAKAKKSLKKIEEEKFPKLDEFKNDQEIGYIITNLTDGKICVVSEDNVVISFKYDCTVKQNLSIINKETEIYNKILGSNKKLVFITDERWEYESGKFAEAFNNKMKYTVIDEPKEVYEEKDNSDIITSRAIEIFGNDIVQFE